MSDILKVHSRQHFKGAFSRLIKNLTIFLLFYCFSKVGFKNNIVDNLFEQAHTGSWSDKSLTISPAKKIKTYIWLFPRQLLLWRSAVLRQLASSCGWSPLWYAERRPPGICHCHYCLWDPWWWTPFWHSHRLPPLCPGSLWSRRMIYLYCSLSSWRSPGSLRWDSCRSRSSSMPMEQGGILCPLVQRYLQRKGALKLQILL